MERPGGRSMHCRWSALVVETALAVDGLREGDAHSGWQNLHERLSMRNEQTMEACPTCGALQPIPQFCGACGKPFPSVSGAGMTTLPPLQRRRKWLRRVGWFVGVPMVLLVVVLIVAASAGDPVALFLAVIAAVVPAVVYARVILSFDRYEIEPLRAILLAFGWGAVGAIIFSLIAQLIFAGLAIAYVGEDEADILSIVVAAPVTEEAFKGLALLLMLRFYRHELDNLLDGLIYGAMIGLGFAMTENILYFMQAYLEDGFLGLGVLFIIRAGVNGLGHAVYTGAFGAAIGWSRVRYKPGPARIIVPIIGYLIAVGLHMAWNGGLVLLDYLFEGASLLLAMVVQVPLVVIPPVLALYFIIRRAHRTEREILEEELDPEVRSGVLRPDEYQVLTTDRLRKQALKQAEREGGKERKQLLRQFYAAAGDLAFTLRHLRLDPRAEAQDRLAIAHHRQELARLRAQLGAARP
jgi:protease PrsW